MTYIAAAHACWQGSFAIFIQIVNVVDFHFQGQSFESSPLGSSNVITSQTVILAHSKGQGQDHAYFDC